MLRAARTEGGKRTDDMGTRTANVRMCEVEVGRASKRLKPKTKAKRNMKNTQKRPIDGWKPLLFRFSFFCSLPRCCGMRQRVVLPITRF